MKKMEKIGKSVLALSIFANTFMPLSMVHANTDPYTITLTTGIPQSTLVKNSNDETEIKLSYDNTDQFITFKDSETQVALNVTSCEDNTCTISVPGDKSVLVGYNSGSNGFDITAMTGTGSCFVDPGTAITGARTLQVLPHSDNRPGTCGAANDPVTPPFDGKTTLIWSCGENDSEVCYKQLEGLSGNEVNYIKGSEIVAENKAGATFNVNAKVKIFSPQDLFESKKADIDNGTIKVGDLVGPDGLDYMPVGEPTENNALVSYGNRQFKAVVYGEEFKGVTIGDVEDLDYYPQKWVDWFLRRETCDMSGTTKDKPVEIDTYLLQKTINLKLQTNLNDYTVTKIEALDVPSDAVIITKKNDGSYDLDFQSNFYDKVVFKVTTDDNKEQFIYINRRTTDPWIRTDNGKEGIVVETFFDRQKSYSDIDVIAKIVYKDGTSKVVHLEAEKGIDNGLGDPIDDYEVDEQTVGDEHVPKGKGMKRANFVYAMSKADLKKVDKIYINIEFKGSTEEVYAGNYAGSGKGDVIDMKYWEDRLN